MQSCQFADLRSWLLVTAAEHAHATQEHLQRGARVQPQPELQQARFAPKPLGRCHHDETGGRSPSRTGTATRTAPSPTAPTRTSSRQRQVACRRQRRISKGVDSPAQHPTTEPTTAAAIPLWKGRPCTADTASSLPPIRKTGGSTVLAPHSHGVALAGRPGIRLC